MTVAIFPVGGTGGGPPTPPTPEAATFVVSPTPGVGDFTTIAAALAALPAEGGYILVREGTYAISATNTIPAGKSVVVRGCGSGTVIDMGGNAIPAFTIPTGATVNTPVRFSDFKVTGTEVATQTFIQYADANGLAEVYVDGVDTVGVELTLDSTSNSSASSTPGQDDPRFHFFRCRIRPCATNNSVILHNTGFGLPRAWLKEVEFIGDSLFAIPALRVAPLFGRLADDSWFGDCYLDSCELSIGTDESDFAAFESFNSTIWNNDNVNTLVTYFLFGSFEGLNPGTVRDSACKGIHFEAEEAGSNFFSNWLVNCPLDIFGADIVIGDNNHIQSGTWPVAQPYVIRVQNENTIIRTNRFRAASTFCVDIEAPCTVIGNDFEEVSNPAGNGTLFIDNGHCMIEANRFRFAPTTGPNVNEVNGPNYYGNNSRLFTNKTGGGPIIDPIIPITGGSTVQGMLPFSGAGAVGGVATNSLIVWYRNPMGLAQTKGYIQNTGANNITVRETFITQNLGTFTKSTVIAPGVKLTIDPFDITGTGLGVNDYQVVDYRVDVSGTAIAWHTYFSAPDSVSAT